MLEEFSGTDGPGGGVLGETDARVVIDGFWRGEENDAAGGGLKDGTEELPADAVALVGGANAEVRAVGDVGKVSEAAGRADEGIAVPGGGGEVGVLEHEADSLGVVEGTAFAESGGVEEVNVLIDGEGVVDLIVHLAIR
jgi:hypothetical protein